MESNPIEQTINLSHLSNFDCSFCLPDVDSQSNNFNFQICQEMQQISNSEYEFNQESLQNLFQYLDIPKSTVEQSKDAWKKLQNDQLIPHNSPLRKPKKARANKTKKICSTKNYPALLTRRIKTVLSRKILPDQLEGRKQIYQRNRETYYPTEEFFYKIISLKKQKRSVSTTLFLIYTKKLKKLERFKLLLDRKEKRFKKQKRRN